MTFDETLTAAVRDLLAQGFDEARVARWTAALAATLQDAAMTPAQVEMRLRNSLTSAFNRATSPTRVGRRHRQVGRFTVQQLAPKLRQELNSRIIASANLIKLDREASIQRTLHRFRGWATSIPPGGSRAESAGKVSRELRKAFASLPFQERRVIIDQGHKLSAAVDDILARNGGAVAAVWHSHWRELNYDYRPEHKARDGKLFVIRGNPLLEAGLMKRAGRPFTDEIDQPAEKIYCRCFYAYLYSLAELPDEMITARGRLALRERSERRRLALAHARA